jgi:hypothetical protein
MGVIKTALEIALEKTETVKSDKTGVDLFEARQRGKKLANAFLAGNANLDEEIKKTAEGQRASLKQGIFDALITQIALPVSEEDEKKLEKTGKGLGSIINDSRFPVMFNQLADFFSKYLQETAHYEQAIRQQYAPKLRQKEEDLSRRMGREVRIDPFQDPEFVSFYNQHMSALKSNYEGVIEQAREETRSMFEAAV